MPGLTTECVPCMCHTSSALVGAPVRGPGSASQDRRESVPGGCGPMSIKHGILFLPLLKSAPWTPHWLRASVKHCSLGSQKIEAPDELHSPSSFLPTERHQSVCLPVLFSGGSKTGRFCASPTGTYSRAVLKTAPEDRHSPSTQATSPIERRRSAWNNKGGAITPEQVAKHR